MPIHLIPTATSTILTTTTTGTVTEPKENQKLFTHAVRHETNHSTERCYHGANAANRPPPRQRRPERQNEVQERAAQNDSNENNQAVA